jgi:hypothetical protein
VAFFPFNLFANVNERSVRLLGEQFFRLMNVNFTDVLFGSRNNLIEA